LHAHRAVEHALRRHLALRVWRWAPAEEEPQDGAEAATAGGAGKEMAARKTGSGCPAPGRCAYFVEKKKRFCKMIVAPGRRFCGEHGQQEVPGLARRSRRPPSPAGEDGLLGPG